MFGTEESYGYDMSYLDSPGPYGVCNRYLGCVYHDSFYKKKILNLVYLDNLSLKKKITKDMVNLVDKTEYIEGEDFHWIDKRSGMVVQRSD